MTGTPEEPTQPEIEHDRQSARGVAEDAGDAEERGCVEWLKTPRRAQREDEWALDRFWEGRLNFKFTR